MDQKEDGFLEALRADPKDDAVRRAYADWLEERGDTRGEFLRLQTEVARLNARLRELAATLDPAWLEDVGRTYRVVLKSFSPDWRLETTRAVQRAAHLDADAAVDFVNNLPATVRDGLRRADADQLARLFFPGGVVAVEPSA